MHLNSIVGRVNHTRINVIGISLNLTSISNKEKHKLALKATALGIDWNSLDRHREDDLFRFIISD